MLSDGIIYRWTSVIFYDQRLGYGKDVNISGYVNLKFLSSLFPPPAPSMSPKPRTSNHCHQTSTIIHELLGKTPSALLTPSLLYQVPDGTQYCVPKIQTLYVVTSPSVATETENSRSSHFPPNTFPLYHKVMQTVGPQELECLLWQSLATVTSCVRTLW